MAELSKVLNKENALQIATVVCLIKKETEMICFLKESNRTGGEISDKITKLMKEDNEKEARKTFS